MTDLGHYLCQAQREFKHIAEATRCGTLTEEQRSIALSHAKAFQRAAEGVVRELEEGMPKRGTIFKDNVCIGNAVGIALREFEG